MNATFFLPVFEAVDATSLTLLRDRFYQLAIRYTSVRADWNFMSLDEIIDSNAGRTALHNSLIDSLNILSRNMAKAGEPVECRKTLGDDRKVIGDFACYVVAWLGIKQR